MSSTIKRNEHWRNNERHYCEVCNVWMGSDRQSIMLHENGKKHKEKVEESLQQKRREKLQEEKQKSFIQASLAKMEQVAAQKVGGSGAGVVGGGRHSYNVTHNTSFNSAGRPPPPPPPRQQQFQPHQFQHNQHHQQYVNPRFPNAHNSAVPSAPPSSNGAATAAATAVSLPPAQSAAKNIVGNSTEDERKAWALRKEQREEERRRKRGGGENDDEDSGQGKRKRIKILPGQGHYSHDGPASTATDAKIKQEEKEREDGDETKKEDQDKITQEESKGMDENSEKSQGKIYLEGQTFYGILEEDMPVQLWTGPATATMEEKRLVERDMHWKNALIVAIRRRRKPVSGDDDDEEETIPVVHVAYLASPDDSEETLEKNVPVDRIRIILGADPSIPETMEEARLLAMGGEEVHVKQEEQNGGETIDTATSPEIDEATGFTSWSTVTIKRTTVRQELKEERARIREQRKRVVAEKEEQKKLAEIRRMEETKAGNADDSALGAFDVLGKGGYKGVNIEKEPELKFEDTAKRLASGQGNVAFKKSKFKNNKKKKQNRRTTSADDD